MLSKESAGQNSNNNNSFDLPVEVLEILPSDPFEQLDVARKITSIALSTRVSALESEASLLRHKLTEKDLYISELQAQIDSLDAALSDASDKLSASEQEKESLLNENTELSNTVKKLNRDVAKLEAFRKKLMRSLQDGEDVSAGDLGAVSSATRAQNHTEDDATLPPTRNSSVRSQVSDIGSSYSEDTETETLRPRISQGLLLASQSTTPRLTPPGSPPSLSSNASPNLTPKPLSPRRHSISFSTSRSVFEDRSSMFSSMPSTHSSMSGLDSGSQSGRTRVDGKEFFRQVRSRLSYEQFGAFLANVKDLNSHKQTREETLRKANEIFGTENKDLYSVFEGLITRNVH